MKKKVLVFASTFPRWKKDTIPPFVYELSKRLTKDFDVTVLTPSFPGAKEEEKMEGMKVKRFHYYLGKGETLASNEGILPALKKSKLNYLKIPFFMLGEFFALRRQVKEDRPDVVHAHWIIPQGFVAALIKKMYGVRYVVTSHGSDIMGLKGFKGIKKFVLRNAERVTVVSNALKKKIKDEIDADVKVDVIPMGIDTSLFSPKKKDNSIKKKYGVNDKFLLFVGRLAPEKGVDVLIESMPEVVREFPRAKLLIIGKGTLEDELKKRAKELKLNDNVKFVGWVDNKELPGYYATADVFVSPSRREGSPVSYYEALACGAPLVVGDLPISKELVGKERGFVVRQEDSKDLADKLKKVLAKKFSSNLLSRFARERADWENVAKKYVEVLR